MNELYDLPAPPDIPGLRFRPLAGVSDAEGLYAIHAGRAGHDGVDPLSTAERLSSREEFVESLAAMTASGGANRTILAEVDGRAVAYNRIFDWTEGDGTRVWLNVGWVLPEWRGRGLGTALLRWSEGRTRDLAGRQPGRWEFAANASSTESEATALLLDNGYRAAYTVLEMELDWKAFTALETEFLLRNSVSMSSGRVEDAPRIAASIDESYRDEYPGGRYAERFDPVAYAAELAEPEHDPLLWRVAWDGDEVIGQVIPLVERGRAEIYEVSVRPAWRRRGVARALLSDALLGVKELGLPVRLHTVAEFPTQAHRLYKSFGFRVLKEFPRFRKAGF